jgi:methyl-accepting chemotaxis protein
VFDGGGGKREKKAAMHLKNWFLGLCLIVLVVGECFLFSANQQKSAALAQANAARQDAVQARADLDQLKAADAAQTLENTKLRSANQTFSKKLIQLQTDNGRLQKSNQQLSQQLDATSASAQQQQEQLQQIAAENQARTAAAQQSDEESARNTCINHLRQIDAAKNEWALENNKTVGAIPTATDIAQYIKLDADGNIPGCPSGGIYTIGAVGVPPSCSIHGVFQP